MLLGGHCQWARCGDTNLTISRGEAFLNPSPSWFGYSWDLLQNLKSLGRLSSQLKSQGSDLSKTWACVLQMRQHYVLPTLTGSQARLTLVGMLIDCVLELSHQYDGCTFSRMPFMGLEQRIQAAHRESKSINISQYLNELTTESKSFIDRSVNFLSFLIRKLGRITMTDRKWALEHD